MDVRRKHTRTLKHKNDTQNKATNSGLNMESRRSAAVIAQYYAFDLWAKAKFLESGFHRPKKERTLILD